MIRHNSDQKWKKINILSSQMLQIKKICKKESNGFANPSQFVNFVLRKELDERKK